MEFLAAFTGKGGLSYPVGGVASFMAKPARKSDIKKRFWLGLALFTEGISPLGDHLSSL